MAAETDRQGFCNFSGNAVHKEKRKIVFADEAGGKLCDVKTFENDRASFTGSSSNKQENHRKQSPKPPRMPAR
ncbi:hypothetical protein D5086_005403 [Populus alba]|uniref:Uncharacterized protein n=1 Tax=Populus alba TaxID=43335 RepID=A0ACC4CV85_POPAL